MTEYLTTVQHRITRERRVAHVVARDERTARSMSIANAVQETGQPAGRWNVARVARADRQRGRCW